MSSNKILINALFTSLQMPLFPKQNCDAGLSDKYYWSRTLYDNTKLNVVQIIMDITGT